MLDSVMKGGGGCWLIETVAQDYEMQNGKVVTNLKM